MTKDEYNFSEVKATPSAITFNKIGDSFIGYILNRETSMGTDNYGNIGKIIYELKMIGDHKVTNSDDETVDLKDGQDYSFYANYNKDNKLSPTGKALERIPNGTIIKMVFSESTPSKTKGYANFKKIDVNASRKPNGDFIIHEAFDEHGFNNGGSQEDARGVDQEMVDAFGSDPK